MLGWQEKHTKNTHLELYDEFDNLVTYKIVTALPPPCNNLATVSKYKVVTSMKKKIVTTLSFLYG